MKTSGVIKKNWEEILTAAMRPDYLNEKRERKEGERERGKRKKREGTAVVLLTFSHTIFHWYSFQFHLFQQRCSLKC